MTTQEAVTKLKPGQVARMLGVCARTVLRYVQVGILCPDGVRVRLRAVRRGRWFLFDRDDVEAFRARVDVEYDPDTPRENS